MDDSGWHNLLQFVADPKHSDTFRAQGSPVVAQNEQARPLNYTPLATPQIPTPPVCICSISLHDANLLGVARGSAERTRMRVQRHNPLPRAILSLFRLHSSLALRMAQLLISFSCPMTPFGSTLI
jgi:hypothetical protein